MYRVLIADDHEVVRRGLAALLNGQSDILPPVQASSAIEVRQAVGKERFDLVILDVSMPGGNAIDLVRELVSEHPRLPILILSVHPEDQLALRLIRAGASGYVSKGADARVILEAVRRLLAGGKWVSVDLAEQLANALQERSSQAPHELLSDREYQVLTGFGRGKTVTEIAEELALSVKTVSTYRARILQKLGLSNSAELIRYALEHRLVE